MKFELKDALKFWKISWFNLQKVSDEVRSFWGNFLPRVRRVHEGGVLDLLADVLVLVERESARKTHLKSSIIKLA